MLRFCNVEDFLVGVWECCVYVCRISVLAAAVGCKFTVIRVYYLIIKILVMSNGTTFSRQRQRNAFFYKRDSTAITYCFVLRFFFCLRPLRHHRLATAVARRMYMNRGTVYHPTRVFYKSKEPSYRFLPLRFITRRVMRNSFT